jgi:hypothetical protein
MSKHTIELNAVANAQITLIQALDDEHNAALLATSPCK